MKKLMNSRRHKLTVICLIVGLLVLTTSVYANFDSANGYSNYKNALKNLAFDTDDVTLDTELEFIVDGESIFGMETNFKVNKNGKSTHQKEWEANGYESETYTYYQDGKEYRYYSDDNTYAEWDYDWNSYGYEENLMGVDMSDKTVSKAIRFAELSADLLIGDLKNNVVLLSNEDGIKEYSVDVSRNQMPEIVNAGISLIFTTYGNDISDRSFVTYENWMDCIENYAEQNGGAEAKQVIRLWHYAEDDELSAAGYDDWDDFYENESDRYDEIVTEFEKYYDDILSNKYNNEGVLLVNNDGSTVHYDTYKDYLFREGNADEYWYYMFGDDPYVSNAKMTVKLNDNNELIENYFEGTLTGVDENGTMHTAKIKMKLHASDYGTTKYDVFNPEGKEKIN